MSKNLKLALLFILIITPIIFYKSLYKRATKEGAILPIISQNTDIHKPKVALIFDDLGEKLKDLKNIYSLDIPLSISIIPGLIFSKNIAHIAYRCGFSVLIHLPLEPQEEESYKKGKYELIRSSLTQSEIMYLLRYYLNSIRIAIGVNNHMGSKATQDPKLMSVILDELKNKGLIFIDSRTSLNSCAYDVAKNKDLACGYNEGFLDSVDEVGTIEEKLEELIRKAKEKRKIIIIAHPKENTFNVLKRKLPLLKREVEFVTLKDYFGR